MPTSSGAKSSGQTFMFVNATPDSEVEKANVRLAVRSNATRFQWRHAASRQAGRVITTDNEAEKASQPIKETTRHARKQTRRAAITRKGNTELLNSKALTGPSITEEADEEVVRIVNSKLEPVALKPMVGAGFVDPFSTFPPGLPPDVVGSLFYHSAQFVPHLFAAKPYDRKIPYCEVWHSHLFTSPALFFAFLFGAVAFKRRVYSTNSYDLQKVHAFCEGQTIKYLQNQLALAKNGVSDEILLVMFILAYKSEEVPNLPKLTAAPSQVPVKSLQMLDFYASSNLHPVHSQALMKVLYGLGDLSGIKDEGLKPVIVLSDLMIASKYLLRPNHPFFTLNYPFYPLKSDFSNRPKHGMGFEVLKSIMPLEQYDSLRTIILEIENYTGVIDDYCKGRIMPSHLSVLADQRNMTQHMLLSVPSLDEEHHPLYEMVRLSLIVYSFIVVFPIPPEVAPFEILATKIQACAMRLESNHMHNKIPELMLWASVMGAFAAMDTKLRPWYHSVLERLFRRLNITNWIQLRQELEDFMWLRSTSDIDAQRLWREIEISSPFLN